MTYSRRAQTLRRLTGGALLALCVGLAIERAGAQQQSSAGANVNVISGTGPEGDWTLQRQNEPTLACSSRNPQHCLAGANDYRTVDIPFPSAGEKMTGDAWLGWYTTKDGGLTWRTRLLPGFPQDTSAAGLASPLRGYAAGADPVLRSGTNGLFYYGGLAFNREEGGGSAIFIARFIDNNNQEGAAGEPIDYLGASIVHRFGAPPLVARRQGRGERPSAVATRRPAPAPAASTQASRVRSGVEQQGGAAQLVDKPWIAVDIPRAGAQTCSIGGPGTGVPLQTFPGGRVYVVYTLFDGADEQQGRIMFSRSLDCGVTWSAPRFLSRVPSADVNGDGVATTADVNLAQASWGRSCGSPAFNPNADINNDCTVNVLDMTFVSRGVGRPVPTQPRLSQGATLAIHPQNGTLQVAWRQFNDGSLPDAIVTVNSANGGASFSPPVVVSALTSFDQGTSATSFRTNAYPTMAIDGAGRAYLAWSTRGLAGQRPEPALDDARIALSTSTNGTTWSAPRAIDNQAEPGHQIMPALTFAEGKLQLVYYDLREDVSQLFGQYVDELPILNGVHTPQLRHTIDVRAAQADPGPEPAFSSFRLSQYRIGAVPGAQTLQQLEFSPPNLPIFRAGSAPFIGDYLDAAAASPFVRNGSTWMFNTAPSSGSVFHAIWTDNRDVRPPGNGDWTAYTAPNPPFPRPAMSGFDPSQPLLACVPGQAGMRNQNIYTARITAGLVVGALTNTRPLGNIQRSFPVFAQNNSTAIRSYRLTIAGQPPGGDASFKQFEPLTTLDVRVAPRSTVARTVFVRSTNPTAQVVVNVTQITEPSGTTVPGGQQGRIVLNPDPTNPELENPELENPELENPELENAEVHNPDLETATTRNPELENPELENPELENPELENATVVNPSILNPELENPELENPELENPELENPELENADLVNGSLSDTTWILTNKGNTAGAFTVKLGLNQQLPTGFRSQLIAHKVYRTPVVLGCSVLRQTQTVLLANIPSPRFVTADEFANPELENPELENLTVALAPGETARITLRVFDPDRSDAVTFRAADSVTPVAVAQSVGTVAAAAGTTQPNVAAPLTSNAPVPGSSVGGTYTTGLGTATPGTWTVGGGSLPPGLTLNPSTGVITGTPTTSGTFTFTARFVSTTGLTDYRTVTITIGAVGAAANVGVTATGPTDPVSIGTPFAFLLNVSNAGPAVATNVRLTDTLPEGTQFVGATTTLGACQHANGTLVCNLGALASGGGATITLTVRPTVGGAHTNSAVVTAAEADPVATNNSAVSTTSTSVAVTPCATVCFSGPTSYIAGPADPEFGGEKGDFNGDGVVDLIFGPVGVNTVGIMLANGAGGFGLPSLIPIPGTPNGVAVADYNNDGHQDIVISSERTAEAWVLLGNGIGQFGAPAIVALPTEPQNVVAADFNRDGNIDLALAGDDGPLVMILRGNGNGTFQPATTIGTTTTFSTVVAEDVNNDTNPDLVVHQEEVGLVIVLGNGAAGFQPPTTIPIADISGVIKTGDLTGDGFADLILGSVPPTGAALHLYVGNGLGGFTPSVMIGDPALTDGAPSVGDFDSDGDLDVVWGRSGGGVGIQLNNGSGAFAAPIYLSSPQVGQILVADFNGDGRPDLALPIGDGSQSQFLVFLNTCDQPPAELAVTLTGPTDSVAEGSPFTYNIEVTNNGPNPATGVQLDFTFDPIAEFVAIGGPTAGCSVIGNRVTCQLGTLALGAVSAFAIDVLPRSGGTLRATAGVTGTTSDPDPANNTAFASTTVTPVASTLVVTNTNRSGPGSLYQAIVDANDPGPRDTIRFDIPGSGPHTIAPTNDLPEITQPVVIDGTTQPGYSGTPLIEINGQNAGTAFGLVVNGSGSIVRGLAINRFHHVGIVLSGAGGHRLEANFIGTNTSGTAALGNLEQGVFISSPNNVIGGATAAERNVISGNTAQGVIILGAAATGNIVSGNFIGSNVLGTARIPNGGAGVAVTNGARNSTIGGTTAGAGNLISGNAGPGVTINGAGTTGNTVAGNFIGTNAAGSAALFNGNSGVVLNTGTTNNTVGGTTAAARNVISGNTVAGVLISGGGTTGNTVTGNFIGTNATATAALPNLNNGVAITGGASSNTVGGSSAAARNILSGNAGSGVRIQDATTTGNTVRGNFVGTNASGTAAVPNGINGVEFGFGTAGNTAGGPQPADGNLISGNTAIGLAFFTVGAGGNQALSNLIGTDVTGTQPLGNGSHGVYMQSNGNRVGSLTTGIGNVIAFNGAYGVRVETGTGNAIVNNSIFANGLMGIDLVPGGLTPNDPGDVDTGSNTLINFPVLSSARTVGANVLVQVALTPTPVGQFQVHYYANAVCDPTGSGEGQTPIGVSSGTGNGSNANLEASFQSSLVPAGSFITATMTDASGNTSEFSTCEQVAATAGSANLAITKTDSPDPVAVGAPLTYLIAVSNTGPDAASNVVVTDVLPAGVTFVSANASIGYCAPSGTTTITVTCTIATINNPANVSISIVVTPTAAGSLSNTASVTATGSDPDETNNSATTTTVAVGGGPSTFVVTNTSNSGAGSFRQAIEDANARQGPDTITFNIPGAAAGVRTISGTPLPTITDQVAIDGTTQPGFAGSPLIELSGANAAAGSNGLVVNAQDSVIRGLIVNRWTGSGIVLQGPAATSVVGSWIGTTSDGTTAAGNGNGILIQTSGHLIGGTTAAERNVISGNTIGVNIGSTSARGNAVVGNYIGTDRTGTLDVGNTQAGVVVRGEANAIGGLGSGNGNVISGNDQAGVVLDFGATANSVEGNAIGTDASRANPLPNGIGVNVGPAEGASSNAIGGTQAGQGNLIAFNSGAGISVAGGSTNNGLWQNAIRNNGALGIDLGADGVTPNDAGDTDEGANERTNFPVLTGVAGGVQGTLNSFPDAAFRIEFFGNTACDASGNGEGATFLGTTNVSTDANGNAAILLFAAAAGQFVTATATDGSNNTSEFSACVTPLGMAAEISVSVADSPDPVVVGGQLSYTVTVINNGPSPATNVRLNALWNGPFNVDATSPAGTCELTPLLVCTFGTLQSGANATLGIVGTPGAIGLLGGSFTIQADEADPVPANNAVAVNTAVVGGPSSFVVTNTNDNGAGTLRQAILNSNASAGSDSISFAMAAGLQTITFATPLPTITDPVTIDGTTQPGFAGTPLIELNGNGIAGNGLNVTAGGTTIRGLVINRFTTGFGINLTTNGGNIVEGNYIGTDAAGNAALQNTIGVVVNASSGNRIGGTTVGAGNLISGNRTNGVNIGAIGSSNNLVQGNRIGTNAAGTAALPNGFHGIDITNAPSNVIGGIEPGASNVISGNAQIGIAIFLAGATGNRIEGNRIGTNVAGTAAVPNLLDGISVTDAPNTIVGGPAIGARNLVSGNGRLAVALVRAPGTVVQGNRIGTDVSGTLALSNLFGISVNSSANCTIGGTEAGEGNVIRFNSGFGVAVNAESLSTRILVNAISDNTGMGIDLVPLGLTPNDAGDVDTGANNLQNFPVLTVAAGGVQGTLNSTPNSTFRIEFFGNTACDASGNGEGATFLGANSVTTDTTGNATVPLFTAAAGQFVTATATDSSNNTSEFSACVLTTESPAITVTATDAEAAELGPNTATFVVTRTGPTTADLDVPITVGGTATLGTDYFLTSNEPLATAGGVEIRIPAGQASATITVNPIFNPAVEDLETITFTVGASVATATIADEPAVTITATDAGAAELGPNTATVVVTRGGASTYDRLVQITVGGTATIGTDYDLTSNEPLGTAGGVEIVIPAGQASATITVSPVFNPAVEGLETITFTVGASVATVTIADEPAATITATDASAAEQGPNTATVVVTRGGASTYSRLVQITVGGAATLGTDYLLTSNEPLATAGGVEIVIPAGQISATITVTPLADALTEGAETVTLTAEGSTATATIVDQFAILTFPVTTTANSGPGSLRQAILDANTAPGNDLITFAIPGAGPQTIAPLSPLPAITSPVVIDGTTQPGFAGVPLIELDGTNAGGTTSGLFITAGSSVVRGLVINRFGTGGPVSQPPASDGGAGIVLSGAGNNVVEGNFIGTDVTGTIARPNRTDGVWMNGPANRIGGTTAATRNVISGNGWRGVVVSGANASRILGNYVGVDASGLADLGNGISGIEIFNSTQTLVGGLPTAGRNIISGNGASGIVISGGEFNEARGNLIGTDVTGANPVPNGAAGITIASSQNFVGDAAAPNTTAFNTTDGIRVLSGNRNVLNFNSSFQNGGLGINLGAGGVTPNDAGDVDGGANNLQNFPVLTAAAGGVDGTLNSAPNVVYRIEVFGNAACDASGNGEGATFLGATSVMTDGTGNAVIPLFNLSSSQFVTATATDPLNNTSEFSACVLIGVPPSLGAPSPAAGEQGATLNVALTGQNTTWVQGITEVGFAEAIAVNSLTVHSPTSATANISIIPTAFTGSRTVTVETGAEEVTTTFTVTPGPATITQLSPASAQQGQSNVNLTITGQGTHFTSGGITTVSFGPDITVNSVTVNTSTSLTANITLGDFATPGPRAVTVTTVGENATIANGFTVTAGTPRLVAVSPVSGQQGQALNVTVTGQFTSFVNGTTTADFGAGVTVNSVTVTSATTATVSMSISPLASPGSRTITMNTGGQSASSLSAGSFFDVTPSAAAVLQISPASGRQAENLSVTITGSNTHFANGSTNIAVGNGITVTSVLVTSPTAVTANLSISPSAALGARAVTATTLGEVATLANAFTVSPGVPAIATVTPETGRQAETLSVTVAGQFTGFVDGTTTASFGSGITVNGVTVTDLTHATVNLTVTPGAALGARTVVLTTGSQVAQLVGGFTVTPGQPTLFSISPVTAVQGTNATVTLNGAFTSFTSGVTTAFFGGGISAGTVTVNGPTLASVPITISPNAQTGLHHVSVTTGSQVVTLLNGFTVQPGEPAISTIDPNAGQRGITRDVSLTGVFTNWQAGITTASYGAGIVVNSNVVHSPTTLTTNITIDPGATLGPRNVVISTGSSALTVPNGFVVTDVDTTPPLVLTVSPSSGTTGLPLNTAVTVEFNEPMNRATITSSSLQLYDTVSGQYLPGVVTVDATGRVARFAPDRLLAVNRTHYVYVNNPITDVAGNHLSGQTHTFTTGFSTDSIGPTLRLTNPRSGDTNIGRNAKVTLQFDRPLNNATRSAGLRIQTGGADVPGTYVLEDGQRRVRFTPAAQLAATADYTVTLTSELRDTAGNSLTNPGSFAFTTGTANDTTAPTVVASSVGNNASLPGLTPQLRLTFNEPINPITITSTTFVIYKPSTNAYIKSTITIAADRLSVTIAPDSPLEPSTQYYFYGQSFEDLAGNTFHPGATYFWTGTAVDTTPPTMVSISPADGATGVPVNARVRAIFSEAVDPTAAVIQLSPPVAGAVAISTDRLALTFTPGVSLSTSTTYAVQISGVRDTSGNLMAAAAASFTTGASATPDTAAPTVVSFSPANAATNVAVNTPVVMTVSEPVRLGDFSTSMRVFVNVVGYGQVQMPGTYTANAARTIVTFTPSVPYPGGAQVQVYSNYDGQITDVSGNVLQSTSMTFTTAAAADTTAPTIVMVTPTDGSTGIGPNAPITLTFSEPLLPTTVSNNTFALFANGTQLSVGISRSADNRTVFLSATLPLEAAITVVATGDVTDLAGNALEDFASTFATGSTFSTTRPQIVAQRPTGNGIPASASITLFSSKPLNPATLDGALYVSQGGVLVEGTVTVSGNGTAIHFDPAGNLDLAALVQVFVTSDVEDTDGNFLFAYSGSFTVTANTANNAPTVVRSSPAFYSSGSPTNAVIDIEFSEPLLASSVVSANLYVVNALSQPVAGQLTLSPDGRVVRFEPANPFAPNNYNYVYMTSGLRDLQNTPFAGTNFYFYAGAEPDDTAPVVTAVSPPEGAANVGISATIRLYVNESVNPVSVSPSTVTLASSAGVIPASVTFNTTNTIVTLVPQVPLPASTALTLTIAGVQDRAANATAPQTVHFTTGAAADTVQPSVIATNVTASGAANVPVNSVFQLTFDEPMDATTVLSQTPTFIYDSSAGYVSGVGSMSSDGLVYTFVPDGPLAVSRQHSLSMYLGTDLAGNPQHGFSFYFSTAFTEDTTPPAVVLVNPAAGSTGVPRNARVEVRFSEPVNATSIGNVRLLRNGQNIGVTRTLSDSNRTLTLRPTIILASNASFTISVAGVRDTRGNVMPATVTSTFSTGSRTDLVVPTILSTNPDAEDSGVGVNMSGRLIFSETIDPLSVTSDTFRIANVAGGPYLDATVSVAADRRSATLVPSAPLLAYTRYYLYLPSFTDVAGNTGSGTTVYFYTGAGVDTTAPTVVALSPPTGVQALPVNTRIIAVMSEAIDRTSLSNASIQLTPAVAGTVALAADRVALTFTPSGNLSPSTAYNVLVNGLRDTAGNTMSAAAFGFTTGASATPDTTAPTIIGRTPTANAAGVGVTSLLTISTSERITAAAVGPSSVPVYAVIPNVGTYQLAGQYSVDSTGTVITFAVFGAFPANTTIQWYTNNNQAIRDMAGLPLPSAFAQFTTANIPDTNGPSILSVSPGAGSVDLGPHTTVTLTFSEAVSPATVIANNFALFAGPTRLFPNLTRSTDNRMVFLTATLPLDETITVVATSGVTDMSGNALTTPFSSSFRTAMEWNFTRPQVVTQRPTGSSVAPGTPITLFLNRPIDPATIAGAFFVSQNGVLVAGTTTVGWSNRAVTFTPAAPFAPQALINVNLTDDARDPSGNLMSPYHGTFTVASDPAATAPTLVRSNPTPYSSGNPTNVVLELEFSEPVDPASVDSTSVFVRNQAGQPVAGQVSMRGDRVVRFVPAANFPPNEYSYFYYNVRDLQGNSLSTNHYFYTGAGADTTAPSAAFVTPASGATGVGVNAMVRVTFSEPINQTTMAGSVTLSAGSPIAATFAISSANDVITITPQLPLPVGTLVTVSVNGVADRAGNAVPITTSTFTTGNAPDITAPTVVAQSTAYGDTAVPVNSTFEVTYSEPIDAATLLHRTNVFYDYTVPGYVNGGTFSISADARTVTFVPPANLVPGGQYSLYFDSVADMAGNVGGALSLYFTAATAEDETPPHVVAANPADGSAGVPLNVRIRLAFDEPVSGVSLQSVNVLVSGLPLPIVSRTLSNGDRVVTLTLGSLLAPNTAHTISALVKDRAGNTMPAFTSTFTTGAGVDLINLSSTVTPEPALNATGVPVSVAPAVNFNEPIDPTTVIYGGVSAVWLRVAATGVQVPVVYQFSADRRRVTMVPASPLAAGTQYVISVSSTTTDVAGHSFPTTVSFGFTTQP